MRPTPSLVLLLALPLAACKGGAVEPEPTPAQTDCGGAEEVVRFATSDGETLEADWWPATEAGRGTAVLFHMVPPSNDRTGWPSRVRAALHDTGVAVLNVDRRGAGGSTGDPTTAAVGEGARLDMEAAVRFLLDPAQACPVDRDALVLMGASNGTTAVYDYVVARDASLPRPARAVFLSPGTYTENQHPLPRDPADWPVDLDWPILWVYPTTEPYSGDFVAAAPAAWRFVEHGNQHGTRMFDGGALEEATVAELTSWTSPAR